MANSLRNGLAGTCTTTGTGPYSGIVNVTTPAAYKAFASLADGTSVVITVRTASQWEICRATKSGGANPSLARTQILDQINGTTNPVNWLTSEEKFIISGLHGPALMTTNDDNSMTAHILMAGKQISWDVDGDSYIKSFNDNEISFAIANGEILKLYKPSGTPTAILIQNDSGALAGPNLTMWRNSSSPAASDDLAAIYFSGNDSGGGFDHYAGITGEIRSATAGGEGGQLESPSHAGWRRHAGRNLRWRPGSAAARPERARSTWCMIGKNIAGYTVDGCEFTTNGRGFFTCNN